LANKVSENKRNCVTLLRKPQRKGLTILFGGRTLLTWLHGCIGATPRSDPVWVVDTISGLWAFVRKGEAGAPPFRTTRFWAQEKNTKIDPCKIGYYTYD
jgi:hypothetical protein